MIIRLRPYIFRDDQCKLFAVGRKSNPSKESDPPHSVDRLSPSTVTAANERPSRNFVPFEYIHDFPRESYRYTAQLGADRRIDSNVSKSRRGATKWRGGGTRLQKRLPSNLYSRLALSLMVNRNDSHRLVPSLPGCSFARRFFLSDLGPIFFLDASSTRERESIISHNCFSFKIKYVFLRFKLEYDFDRYEIEFVVKLAY